MRSGKVREGFDLGETLLFVATDRISALGVILIDPIPKKGAVLKTKPLPVENSAVTK
jgi:phosphoribosylaminoimidazole-succinocarboxamide synthase